jgi:acyl-CoA synthetase (NDP forming)
MSDSEGETVPASGEPPPLDVSGRPLALRPVDLDRFFRPRSLAVIGASDTEGRPNTAVWRKLRAWADRAGVRVYPVNPNRDIVDGLRCHRAVADVPEQVDVGVVLVADALAAVGQLADAGARFAVVFSSGFAETGPEGEAAQARLVAALHGGDLRLLGPNTNLNAFETFRDDLTGPAIALVSQSGHQGRPIFQAQEIGIRVSHWAPTGNEADLEFADFAAYLAGQPEVGVVAGYVEGFADGRALMLAADAAARDGVPIVLVKVGRTGAGTSMAASHTGKLTGADAVADAVFRQYGITRVDGLDELLDTAQLLARGRPPRGDGVCVYAISGGTGAHMADLCAAAGLRLPALSEATQAALHQWIPDYLRVSNPVDSGGHPVGDERGRRILDTLLADPAVGVLICPITGAFPPMSDRFAADLVAVAETTDKPICVVWGSPAGTEPAYRDVLLGSDRLAVFRTFGNCVTAVRAYLDHAEFRHRYRSPFANAPRVPSSAGPAARAVLAADGGAAGPRSEHTAKRVLEAYGIPTPLEELVSSSAQAVRAAARIGYPVVLKAGAAGIAHKSDLGLVRLGLTSASQVRRAYAEISRASPQVLVAEEVTGGVEMVLGVSSDEVFGPAVTVGLGGVLVEVLGDVAVRVPPFDRDETYRMLAELRGLPLLRGVRGRPPADVEALVDAIGKVQRLSLELAGTVTELDINPLLVLPEGRGVVALDALVVTREEP